MKRVQTRIQLFRTQLRRLVPRRIYVAIFLAAVLFAGMLVWTDKTYRVSSITVSTSRSPESIELAYLGGLSMITSSEDEFAALILRRNPILKSVRVRKTYPSQISVYAEAYFPVAALESGDGYFFLSREGVIAAKSKDPGSYPVISYYQRFPFAQYEVGDSVSYQDIAVALFMLGAASVRGVPVTRIDIGGIDMIVLNSLDRKFIFTSQKDKEAQEYEFSALIDKLGDGYEQYQEIDLRFDKPVLKLRSEI